MPGFRLPSQLPDQIAYLRRNARVQGSVYFSAKSLMNNPLGFVDSLRKNYYRFKALPPAMPWLDSIPPNAPTQIAGKAIAHSIRLTWQAPPLAKDYEPVYGYVIYRFAEQDKVDTEDATHVLSIQFNDDTWFEDHAVMPGQTYLYVITAIDRLKNESERSPAIFVTCD